MLERLRFYGTYAWRFAALGRLGPLIYGLDVTNRCNLACAGCRVSNTGRPDMSWEQIAERLQGAYDRGFRELYFTGGEPMLWREGGRSLDDVIHLARRIGFFHVHVYTNGTCGLDCAADLVWVSMDGLPGTYETRRGDHFAEVEAAIRASGHPRTAVVYVVDRYTAAGVEPFLHWARDTRLPVLGVMAYFHTPYYGRDDRFLDAAERAPVVNRLLACRRKGLPLLNSRAGLLALRSGRWPRRLPLAVVADMDGESVCCRAPDAACPDCGYSACPEIAEALRLAPSAIAAMARYW